MARARAPISPSAVRPMNSAYQDGSQEDAQRGGPCDTCQHAGRLDNAGDRKRRRDADRLSEASPQRHRRHGSNAEDNPDDGFEGANCRRGSHDGHEEGRSNDVAETKQPIGNHQTSQAAIDGTSVLTGAADGWSGAFGQETGRRQQRYESYRP